MDKCEQAVISGLASTLRLRGFAHDAAHERWLTWPVSRKEAFYNNHGMGSEWLLNRAVHASNNHAGPYTEMRCEQLTKEINALQECVDKISASKTWHETCKGAFWQPGD